jgi:cytochrome c553
MCQGCHGIVGWRTASRRFTASEALGTEPQYIVLALKQYKSGDRGHPTMKAIAASLSDDDMANIAAYYSQAPLTTAAK